MACRIFILPTFNAGNMPTITDTPTPTTIASAMVEVLMEATTAPLVNESSLAIARSRTYRTSAYPDNMPIAVPTDDNTNACVTESFIGNWRWAPSTRKIPNSRIFSSMEVVRMPLMRMPEIVTPRMVTMSKMIDMPRFTYDAISSTETRGIAML